MHSAWVRWIAYLVLASLVVVTSCQAWAAGAPEAPAMGWTGERIGDRALPPSGASD